MKLIKPCHVITATQNHYRSTSRAKGCEMLTCGSCFCLSSVCACLYDVCMCVHMCVDTHVLCASVCGSQRLTSLLLNHFPPYPLRMNLGLTNLARQTSQQAPQGSSFLLIPSDEVTGAPSHLDFIWVLRIKLRSSCLNGKHFIDWALSSALPCGS